MEPRLNIEVSATTDRYQKEMAKAGQITERTTKLMADSISVVGAKQEQLNKTLSSQLKNLSDLTAKYGANSDAALKMATAAERTRKQLEQLNPALNPSIPQRAASGFNALNNSVAQLGREMPAFGNSFQTGAMAISNNIPALFDAIKGIKEMNAAAAAAGKPVQSVFSQLAGAVFSWNTALSVGVTLLTVYGKEIGNVVNQLFSAKKATEENGFATQDYITKLIIASQILKDRKLFGVGADVTKSIQTAQEQIKNLEIQVKLKQQGISQDEYDLKIAKEKLAQLQAQEAADKKIMAGRIILMMNASQEERMAEDRLRTSENQIEAQKQLVTQLQKQVGLQKQLSAPKQEVIKTTNQDFLRSARENMAKLPKEFHFLGANSATYFAAGFAAADPIKLTFENPEIYTKAVDVGKMIGQAFANGVQNAIVGGAALIGQAIGEMFAGASGADNFFKGLIGLVTDFMQTLGAAMIAAGVASDVFQKSLFTNPVAAIAAGVGLVAAAGVVKGLMKEGLGGTDNGGARPRTYRHGDLPKMANGGLLYGETAFVGGEYPGASSNPEVVAPLNKLKSILGGGGAVEGVASGRNLHLVAVRTNQYRRRNFGR